MLKEPKKYRYHIVGLLLMIFETKLALLMLDQNMFSVSYCHVQTVPAVTTVSSADLFFDSSENQKSHSDIIETNVYSASNVPLILLFYIHFDCVNSMFACRLSVVNLIHLIPTQNPKKISWSSSPCLSTLF